jgi:hypothetical protein
MITPPTSSVDRSNGAQISAARECPFRWAVRERVDHRPIWAGGAAGRELETTILSCPASRGWHDDDTSTPRRGKDEDDLDMLLQSTAALATSPLHNGSGDGSLSEETPCSPTFHLLLRSSLRSRLAI